MQCEFRTFIHRATGKGRLMRPVTPAGRKLYTLLGNLVKMSGPSRLQKLCLQHILIHLEQFPTCSLIQLPLHVRKEIIWNLPIADVCRLGETSFICGIDMEDYWSEKPRVDQNIVYERPDWQLSTTQVVNPRQNLVTKDWCYAEVLHNAKMDTTAFSGSKLLNDISSALLDKLRCSGGDDIITYLFAMRASTRDSGGCDSSSDCDIIFPPRYAQRFDASIADLFQNPAKRSVESLHYLMDAAVHCFGELPKALQLSYQQQHLIMENCIIHNPLHPTDMSSIMGFFSELRYFAMVYPTKNDQASYPLIGEDIHFVEELVKRALNLEVLIIEEGLKHAICGAYIHIDSLFTELSSLPFLSKFHSLVVASRGILVSQVILDNFLKKFLSTPCDHPQSVKLAYITVYDFMLDYLITEGARPPPAPFWHQLPPKDRSYLHLKSIEFVHPHFTVEVPLTGFASGLDKLFMM